MRQISPKNYSTVSLLATAGLLMNLLVFRNLLLGILALAVIVFLWILALEPFFRDIDTKIPLRSSVNALLFLSAAYTVISTAIYAVRNIDTTVFCALLLINSALQIFFFSRTSVPLHPLPIARETPRKKWSWIFLIIGICSLAAAWATLFQSGSDAALRSPWEVLPIRFLLFLAVAILAVFVLAKKQYPLSAAVLGSLTVATGLSVAAVVYSIGYGFDPFIHEAAMREIVTHGVVLPKTPYYLGAYTLLVSLHRLIGIGLHTLNTWAGPALGAIALTDAGITATAFIGWGTPIAILVALVAPLGHFIQTTPQGIADAWALLAITAALRATHGRIPWLLAYTLALAATATHPLAGVPALGVVALTHVWMAPQKKWRLFFLTVLPIALVIFPIIAFQTQSPINTHLSLIDLRQRVSDLIALILHSTSIQTFSPWRTLLYSGRALFPVVFIGVVALVVRRPQTTAKQRAVAAGAVATAIGGIFLALFVRLEAVPTYEQFIFPLRFVSLAALFLLPLFLEGVTHIIQNVARQKAGMFFIAGVLALALPGAVYLAYPRLDPEDRSGGRSVSAGTLEAVRLIHNEHPKNAIVLANQTAAAAEIWRYGFTRYVNREFYYSHPSGAPQLYEYYLEAVNIGPSRDIMERAMNAYDADSVYFLLHDYWKNSTALFAHARTSADRVIDLSNEGVMIFVYNKKE
jgi:hypothetical protein